MSRTSLDMLSGILWRERDVLQHVLTIAPADPESTELALRSLSSLELHRAILAREVAAEHAIAGEPSLPDLIGGVPSEWSAVLSGHRRALVQLAGDVDGALDGVTFAGHDEHGDSGHHLLQARAGVQRSLVDFLG